MSLCAAQLETAIAGSALLVTLLVHLALMLGDMCVSGIVFVRHPTRISAPRHKMTRFYL